MERRKKENKWTRYYDNGEIAVEGLYKNNKRDGQWKSFNRKGDVTSDVTFKDGLDTKVLSDAQKKLDAKKAMDAKKAGDKKGGAKQANVPGGAKNYPATGTTPKSPADTLKK